MRVEARLRREVPVWSTRLLLTYAFRYECNSTRVAETKKGRLEGKESGKRRGYTAVARRYRRR